MHTCVVLRKLFLLKRGEEILIDFRGFTSDQDFSNGMMCATAISSGVTISNLVQKGVVTATPNSVLQSSTKLLAGGMRILYQASDSAALAPLITTSTTTTGSNNAVGLFEKVSTVAVTTSAILAVQTSGASFVTETVGLTTVFTTITTFSSSSSLPSGTPAAASTGISAGAKAGIAVGVVGLVGCVLLLIFFFSRRRARQHNNQRNALQQQQEQEGMVSGRFIDGAKEEMSDKNERESTIQSHSQQVMTPTNAQEMITEHNTPEMETKANIAESPGSPMVHEIDNGFGGDYHDVPYHDPGAIISSPAELDNQYIVPSHKPGEMAPRELDARPRLPSLYGPELGLGSSPEPERSPHSRARMGSIESFATARSDESPPRIGETEVERLARKQKLKDKMARIKEEKERLQRMQELSSLEEETLRELNEEEARVRGS